MAFATGQHAASGPADHASPLAVVVLLGGPVGEVALFGYFLLRRFQRRRGRAPQTAFQNAYAPLAGTVVFAGLAVTLAMTTGGGITGHHPLREGIAAGSLAVAALSAARTRRKLRDRRRTQ